MDQKELLQRILAIQNDPTLSDEEKGRRRQALLAGKWAPQPAKEDSDTKGAEGEW